MYILVFPAKTDRPIIFGVGNATCTSRLTTPARLHTTLVDLDLPFPDVMIYFRTVNTTLKCNFVIILHHIILGHLHSTGLIFRSFSQLHLHPFHATINHAQSRTFINRRLRIYIQSYLIVIYFFPFGYSICITAILTAMIRHSFNLSE